MRIFGNRKALASRMRLHFSTGSTSGRQEYARLASLLSQLSTVDSKIWMTASVGSAFLGVLLRLRTFQLNHALWLDESSLALNVLKRSFLELATPLDYSQGAPLLFLWLQKAATLLTHSSSEYALRLVPLVLGCAACILLPFLCRELQLSPLGTFYASTLFALSPGVMDFSCQAKQYSGDVFVAIAIPLASCKFLKTPSWKVCVLFCAAGVAAMGLSHPAVFVLAGTGLTVLFAAWRSGQRRTALLQAVAAALWLTAFGLSSYLLLRHLYQVPGLVDYWERQHNAFMPLTSAALSWLPRAALNVVMMTGFHHLMFLLITAVGAAILWAANRRTALMLFLPIVCAIIASGFRAYPFADRLTLFVAPALMISASFGLSTAPRCCGRLWLCAGFAAFCLLCFAPAKRAAALFVYPERFGREEFREAFMSAVSSLRCPGSVFVYETAANHYRYYNEYRWSKKYNAVILSASQLRGEIPDINFPSSFCVVTAHTSDAELSWINERLRASGFEGAETFQFPGARAEVYVRTTRRDVSGSENERLPAKPVKSVLQAQPPARSNSK